MSKHKVSRATAFGQADANTDFDDLCALLRHLGFEERIKGSHHIFRHEAAFELMNL